MNAKQYILSEIASENELEQFLRLRYPNFSRSESSFFLAKNSIDIDLNYYDRHSIHFGIYSQQDKKKQAVGYFRIVLEEPTMAEQWVRNISDRAGLTNITEHKPQARFPCFGIYPHTGLEQEFYSRKGSSEKAGEVSRFFIIQSERSVRLSLQIIKRAFAIALMHIQHAFVGCFHDHARAYMKFGFRQCPGTTSFFFDLPSVRKEGLILYCKTQYLTDEFKTACSAIQEQFLSAGRLTFSSVETPAIACP